MKTLFYLFLISFFTLFSASTASAYFFNTENAEEYIKGDRINTLSKSISFDDPCPPGDVILQSQEEVNAYVAMYPNCTQISGNLQIGASLTAPILSNISDISGLLPLTSVDGFVSIRFNPLLLSLNGLNNLNEVGGYFSLNSNSGLTNIDDINNLVSIGGYLTIQNNAVLTTVNGLESLVSIGEYLFFGSNTLLTGVGGLQNLTSIGAYLSFNSNPALTTISGLNSLVGVVEYMQFINNASLVSVTGLNSLETVGANLNIGLNPSLVSVSGLMNLQEINGALNIQNNSLLSNLSGLQSLTTVGGFVFISGNSAMTSLEGLNSLTSVAGVLSISANPLLNSIEALSMLESVGGSLFINNNTSMNSLNGFINLQSIGGSLSITDNPLLNNMEGLNGLVSIGTSLVLTGNGGLISLDGLDQLAEIGAFITIANNPQLISLFALSSVISLNETLNATATISIFNNPLLVSLNGLQDMDLSNVNNLRLFDNALLSICDLPNICEYLAEPTNTSEINNNAMNCADRPTVEAACQEDCVTCPEDLEICVDAPSFELTGASPSGGTWSGEGVSNGVFDPEVAGPGTHIITYEVTDLDCTGTCIFSILVYDLPVITCPENTEVCADEPAFTLSGALPAAGEYSGPGVSSGIFDPSSAIQGENTITYTYSDENNCSNTCSFNISVNNLPEITCPVNISTTIENAPFALTGATPVGGIYSGDGVSMGVFDPVLAGLGIQVITYEFTDINACSNTCTFNIEVTPIAEIICPGSITFSTQTQIDNFTTTYPGCKVINGNTTISGSAITNLNGLNVLEEIKGFLLVSNNSNLTNINGLNNLHSIDSFLVIQQNVSLQTINGFNALETVGYNLLIRNNNNLQSINGLDNITSIGHAFQINNNPVLAVIDEFPSLQNIQFSYFIASNSQLTSLGDLPVLTTIGNAFAIQDNPLLSAIPDFASLVNVDDLFIISGNSALNSIGQFQSLTTLGADFDILQNNVTSIPGFNSLLNVDGYFRIGLNNNLNNISGFQNLEEVSGLFALQQNPVLQSVSDFASLTDIGTLSLTSNNNLTSIDFFPSLESVELNLVIANNAQLVNIAGFNSLQTLGNSFSIRENPSLQSISGFSQLSSIGNRLHLVTMPALNTINAFQNLSFIGDSLQIANTNVENLNAFNHPILINGNLRIQSNPSLSNCEAEAICTYLEMPLGLVIISNNNTGCNSPQEVETACNVGDLCPPGDVILHSQDDVDAYVAMYPNCTHILGNLEITSVELPSITDISGLLPLITVEGFVNISSNSLLQSLSGLDNLNTIGVYLSISDNEALINIDALSNLTSVESSIFIGNNPLLTSIDGFNNLLALNNSIQIYNNFSLVTINGFENLTELGDDVWILDNMSLTSVQGFSNLQEVRRIRIVSNALLDDISGFQSLASTESSVDISNNSSLTSLVGLNSLMSIGGELTIVNNSMLSSLSGLESLESVGTNTSVFAGGVRIQNNATLNTLIGLSNLETIRTGLSVLNNPQLSNLEGLNKLTSIGSTLAITGAGFINLDGLDQLNSVGGISIFSNPNLVSLSALSTITDLNPPLPPFTSSIIEISNNNLLSSLDGIQNTDLKILTFLSITSNPLLSICNMPNICAYLTDESNQADINNNAPGCAIREEVIESCDTCPTITAVLSGQVEVCPGSATSLNLSISGGTEPYTVVLQTPDMEELTFQVIDGLTLQDPVTGTYTLLSVTDMDDCTAGVEGSAIVVVEDNVPPVAVCINTTVYIGEIGTYELDFDEVLDFELSVDNCSSIEAGLISPSVLTCDDVNTTVDVLVQISDLAGLTAVCTSSVIVLEDTNIPTPWTEVGIGANSNGTASFEPCASAVGSFNISSNGGTPPSGPDNMHGAFATLCGNGTITARVISIDQAGAAAGVIIRETMNAGSRKFALKTRLSNFLFRDTRLVTNGLATSLQIPAPGHTWLRIIRQGNSFTAYSSLDGTNWLVRGAVNLILPACIDAGIFVEGAQPFTLANAEFSNVTIEQIASRPNSDENIVINANEFTPNISSEISELSIVHVLVSPNPFADELVVDIPSLDSSPFMVKIFDSFGRLVLSEDSYGARLNFDTAHLQNGIYFIHVLQSDQLIHSNKLLKIK